MTLKIAKSKKINGTTFKEGHCYEFNYQAYQNDPKPLIFFINSIFGTHPNTGHQWRLIQAININYIPRKDRKRFVEVWEKEMSKGKGVEFSWSRIKSQFPYIEEGIRRYSFKPNYFIRNIRYIPPDKWREEVVKAWHKDFSGAIRRKIASKLKRIFTGRRR